VSKFSIVITFIKKIPIGLRFGKYHGIYLFGWSITTIPIFEQWLADRTAHNKDFPKIINAHYTQKKFAGLVFTKLK
jgi:hypothetical protein